MSSDIRINRNCGGNYEQHLVGSCAGDYDTISSIDVCRFPNGNGILSGSVSHFGRGLEEEMREKKGFFEKLVEKKKEQP